MARVNLLAPVEILDLLERQPSEIRQITAALSEEQLHSGRDGQWSIRANLEHLYACEVVWGKRIDDMLTLDHPTLRALHPMTWLAEQDLVVETFASLLGRFSEHRTGLLRRLSRIPESDWQRGATFTGGGKPRQYTVHTEADALTRHERAHVKTIQRYARAIG